MVEAAGFDGIFKNDGSYARAKVVPGTAARTQHDPLTSQLILAAATEHVEVGLAALQLPLANPSTLHNA